MIFSSLVFVRNIGFHRQFPDRLAAAQASIVENNIDPYVAVFLRKYSGNRPFLHQAYPGHVPFSASRGSHAMMQPPLGLRSSSLSDRYFLLLTTFKELVSCSVHGIPSPIDNCHLGNS